MDEIRYMDAAAKLNLMANAGISGVVFWKPNGLALYENLKAFIRQHHRERGYLEVRTPSLVGLSLFKQSGHLDKYRENMFVVNQENGDDLDVGGYGMRPMSCPNHIVLYQSELRSYRDLPLRLFEFGEVFRNEASGALQNLFRMRQFCQDDSHVFVAQDDLVASLSEYLQMAQRVYALLGFKDISYAISLRPAERFGSDAEWDAAEDALREACAENGISWAELEGEGAFYGPKVELQVKDKLGRGWQLGTLQLDYVLPQRFKLEYVNAESGVSCPVLLHHAVLGSLERMIGILLEGYGAALPPWLHPSPVVLLPVSDKVNDYANHILKEIKQRLPNVVLDKGSDTLGARLRNWKKQGVPYQIVVGEAESSEFKSSGVAVVSLNNRRLELKDAVQEISDGLRFE